MENFVVYTYLHNYHLAFASALAGIIFGVIYTRHRNRKAASIIFCVLLTTCLGYPLFSLNGYLVEHQWHQDEALARAKQKANKVWMKQQCDIHKDYIMRVNTCYKPYNGYIPLTTYTINTAVGDAMAATDSK